MVVPMLLQQETGVLGANWVKPGAFVSYVTEVSNFAPHNLDLQNAFKNL